MAAPSLSKTATVVQACAWARYLRLQAAADAFYVISSMGRRCTDSTNAAGPRPATPCSAAPSMQLGEYYEERVLDGKSSGTRRRRSRATQRRSTAWRAAITAALVHDHKHAFKLWSEAAEKGHALAKVWVTRCHLSGFGTPHNAPVGIALLNGMVQASPSPEALVALAEVHEAGAACLPRDVQRARELYEQALALDPFHSGAQCGLGLRLLNNLSSLEDLRRAEQLLDASADPRADIYLPRCREIIRHCFPAPAAKSPAPKTRPGAPAEAPAPAPPPTTQKAPACKRPQASSAPATPAAPPQETSRKKRTRHFLASDDEDTGDADYAPSNSGLLPRARASASQHASAAPRQCVHTPPLTPTTPAAPASATRRRQATPTRVKTEL